MTFNKTKKYIFGIYAAEASTGNTFLKVVDMRSKK